MSHDKQLLSVELDQVMEKRRLDQALNAKEFAVLAGISYSAARAWFRRPGFPLCCGVVFWQDFVQWRNAQAGLNAGQHPVAERKSVLENRMDMPARARRILAEAG